MKLITLPQLPNFKEILKLPDMFGFPNILNMFKLNTLVSLFNEGFNLRRSISFILVSAVLYIVLNHLFLPLIYKISNRKPNDKKSKSSSFHKKRYNKLESSTVCVDSKSCSTSSSNDTSSSSDKKKQKKSSVKLSKIQIKNTLRKFKLD